MSDPIPAELVAYHQAKLGAETRKLEAEIAKLNAEADEARAQAEVQQMELERTRELRTIELAGDYYHHHYSFLGGVSEESCRRAITQLTTWQRRSADAVQKPDIEILFNSPGGDVIAGMALFDVIQQVRAAGHLVTTSAIGYAASMGGILLQAGDVRVMGREAYVLIHQISTGVRGKVGDIEDELQFIKKIQDRVLNIFAARSKAAHEANPTVCTHPLTKKQFEKGWERKDWWLSSAECLKHGIVDSVR